MDPLLRSCNIFLGETSISVHASWLSIHSSMPRVLPPHVSCTLLAMASRASFISMNVLASIHTNSISLSFFRFDTKVWRGRLISKKVSANVIRCHQMSSDVRYTLVYDIFSLFPGKIRHGGSGWPVICKVYNPYFTVLHFTCLHLLHSKRKKNTIYI